LLPFLAPFFFAGIVSALRKRLLVVRQCARNHQSRTIESAICTVKEAATRNFAVFHCEMNITHSEPIRGRIARERPTGTYTITPARATVERACLFSSQTCRCREAKAPAHTL